MSERGRRTRGSRLGGCRAWGRGRGAGERTSLLQSTRLWLNASVCKHFSLSLWECQQHSLSLTRSHSLLAVCQWSKFSLSVCLVLLGAFPFTLPIAIQVCEWEGSSACRFSLPLSLSSSLRWHIMYVANKGSRASRRRRRRRRRRSGRRKSFVFRNSEGVDARGVGWRILGGMGQGAEKEAAGRRRRS